MADKEEGLLKVMLVPVAISTGVIVVFAVLVRSFALERRVAAQNGQYLVSVRYPGQLNDIHEFVQPHNPDVLAICSQIGAPWALYDWVCQNINYRRDVGEFWQTPSETLRRGYGDCEDSANLLTSLLRNFSNAYTTLGSYQGYGHAWTVSKEGEILEATYTEARHVPDPENYCPYCMFNESEVIELWPGALGEVFALRRDEATKLNLIAEAVA